MRSVIRPPGADYLVGWWETTVSKKWSGDEHAQTSVSEYVDRHSPRCTGAQTAEKQHAGLLKLDAQPRLG